MNSINGKTKVYGLIGNPVEHTFSPFIHNTLAKKSGINMVYVPFHVENNYLQDALNGIRALNIKGINITVPHKINMFNLLESIDEKAKKIGAINVVKVNDDYTLHGFNTDADGLLKSCKRAGIVFEDKSVCIIGAGGAARAVSIMCAEESVSKIYIINRTISKAVELKKLINEYYNDIEVTVLSYNDIDKINNSYICFQTTSIGMHPNIDESPIEDNNFLQKFKWAVDLVYNPHRTKFLKIAKENNVNILNGLGMLYFQAVEAFETWNNINVEDNILEECLEILEKHVYN